MDRFGTKEARFGMTVETWGTTVVVVDTTIGAGVDRKTLLLKSAKKDRIVFCFDNCAG